MSRSMRIDGPAPSPPINPMTDFHNALGQRVGFPVRDWRPPPAPAGIALHGDYCRLEKLNGDAHAQDLHTAYSSDTEHRIWSYLPYGPFGSIGDYRAWVDTQCSGDEPLFHAIIDGESNRALGVASYLRINPRDGTIEVGHVNYSPLLQKTIMATEAMFLLMRHAFDDLGYRRYEWKCDALNENSRTAALRLGFTFEGIFRQATMYRQRNRDTAWYSIIDLEWPKLRIAYEKWLSQDNFEHGSQKKRLSEFLPE